MTLDPAEVSGRRGHPALGSDPGVMGYQRHRHAALALMFVVGSTLALLVLALPHGPGIDVRSEAIVGSLGYPAGAILWMGAHRLPRWTHHLILDVGICIVSFGIYLGHGSTTSLVSAFFYIWVALYAFAYFSWQVAAGHVLAACAAYAVVLAVQPPSGAPAVYVLVVGTTVISGFVVALLRRQLVRFAVTDELTGLPNRYAYRQTLAREMARAARTRDPLAVVLLDINDLKGTNDRGGHAAGDALLVTAAKGWRRTLRASDLLVRYGGDEFALILPATPAAEAHQAVDRLRVACPEVSFSAGIAAYLPDDSDASLTVRADADLYQAKRRSRTLPESVVQ